MTDMLMLMMMIMMMPILGEECSLQESLNERTEKSNPCKFVFFSVCQGVLNKELMLQRQTANKQYYRGALE